MINGIHVRTPNILSCKTKCRNDKQVITFASRLLLAMTLTQIAFAIEKFDEKFDSYNAIKL